jgi:hypothetical protein
VNGAARLGALAALLAAMALTAAEQPLLLPMPELLKHLDRSQEWLMLPLADYQALVAAGKRPVPDAAHAPGGAWIGTARIAGRIEDDRRLRLHADLEVEAAAPGAAICRLFARAPDAIGLIILDDAPALQVRRADGGIDLLVPGPGRHRVGVTWTAELADGADGARGGTLPLPLAAGLAAVIGAERDGDLLGEGLVARDGRNWTLVTTGACDLALTWHPGRHGGETAAAWGLQQTVVMTLPDGAGAPRPWRWTATPTVLRGQLPADLVLHLPAGWTATTPGSGVREPSQAADGTLHLRVDPGASELVIDGVAAAGAAIALPAVDGAIWQGGRVVLTNAIRVDWVLPPRWRRVATDTADWRAFAVPGPDAGLTLAAVAPASGLEAEVSTTVALGPERWRMDAEITVPSGAEPLFALPIRLPGGWRAVAGSCSLPARIAGADADGAFSETPADGVLRIALPQGLSAGCVVIRLALEREPAIGPVDVAPPLVLAAHQGRHRLVVAAAPSHDVQVTAAGWRRDDAAQVPDSAGGRTVRAVLVAAGEAPALQLNATAKRAGCDAEAMVWLLPLDGALETAVWCRIDLRLTVSDGELDAVAVELPLAAGSERLADPALTLVQEGARTLLRASRPWRGERLVRIEGRLAGGNGRRVGFPRLAIARDDGAAVPTILHVALQAPERLDLRLEPGPAAQAEDEDDLPRWSRPIPGDPLAGAWRLGGGDAGGFALVSRPLVDPPPGFVHRLEVRTQIGAGRARSLLRLRLAAPGLDALPLGLPAGVELVAASLDGRPAAVRRIGGDAVLPLPGRTQVDVVLLLDAPIAAGRVDLVLPGLVGLPVTSLAWTVAADADWLVRPGDGAEAMHLTAQGAGAARPWFGTWHGAAGGVDPGTAPPPAVLPAAGERDPRLLPPPLPPAVLVSEPSLALVGQVWSGERLGPARLVLSYRPLGELRRVDHLGAALAVLFGAWLGWRLRTSAALVVATAALALAGALHAGALGWPLLAVCEWLGPVLAAVAIARALAHRLAPPVPRPREVSP